MTPRFVQDKIINPFLATDGYKTGHHKMYPKGTTMVYSNWTPRSNKYCNIPNNNSVVVFGTTYTIQVIDDIFSKGFFERPKDEVIQEIKEEYEQYLGCEYDVTHIEKLHDLGYLPICVKALPEGTLCPYGVPYLTIKNTIPEFYWITNFLETIISNLLWLPSTSATTAFNYKKLLYKYATLTDVDNTSFVDYQGHDFSSRGMESIDSSMSSGMGFLTSFLGTDNLPAIWGLRKYYLAEGNIGNSVNATEHSVMCAGTKENELETFRYLMEQFPTGILSIVSDTWNLWDVLTKYLPILKEEILNRDGKIVIRPDTGDPVDIICGINYYRDITELINSGIINVNNPQDFLPIVRDYLSTKQMKHCSTEVYTSNVPCKYFKDNKFTYLHIEVLDLDYTLTGVEYSTLAVKEVEPNPEDIGVIECLWNLFGGTINSQGYRVLNPHIGAIYGDSITYERAENICKKLKENGFATTNVVLGIGSYTMSYCTRDTHGFALKATYCEIQENGKTVGKEIFKDPITGDGMKKSAKGLLSVIKKDGVLTLKDQCTKNEENSPENELRLLYFNGDYYYFEEFQEIKDRLHLQLLKNND